MFLGGPRFVVAVFSGSSARGSLAWSCLRWLVCLLLTIGGSLLILRGLHVAPCPRGVAAGWVLAGVNGLAALQVNRRATAAGREQFLRWGIIGNLLRLLTLVAILILCRWLVPACFQAFGLTVVAGALVFMVGEVSDLYRQSGSGWGKTERGDDDGKCG